MTIPFPLRIVSRWLNVVLDLNGILCVCAGYRFLPKIALWKMLAFHSSFVPMKIGLKVVYVRSLCSKFLSERSDFADIIVWSSMHKSTTPKICEYLFKGSAHSKVG